MKDNESKTNQQKMVRRRNSQFSKAEDERRRREFFEELNAAYEELRKDPEAWRQYQEEAALLEGTLMDGLEDEPPYPLDESSSA